MKNNHKGFAVVEALLIVLILVIIAFGGYYVWHTQKESDKSLDQAVKTSQSTSSNSNTSGKNSSSPQKYVTIKEWGIRAPYSGNLTLEYNVKPGGSSGGATWPEYALFSSAELDVTDPSCKGDQSYGGAIDRYQSTDEYLEGDGGVDSGKTAAQYAVTLDKTSYGHVGNYYYFYTQPQGVCGTSQASQDKQSETHNAVLGLLPKFEALPQ